MSSKDSTSNERDSQTQSLLLGSLFGGFAFTLFLLLLIGLLYVRTKRQRRLSMNFRAFESEKGVLLSHANDRHTTRSKIRRVDDARLLQVTTNGANVRFAKTRAHALPLPSTPQSSAPSSTRRMGGEGVLTPDSVYYVHREERAYKAYVEPLQRALSFVEPYPPLIVDTSHTRTRSRPTSLQSQLTQAGTDSDPSPWITSLYRMQSSSSGEHARRSLQRLPHEQPREERRRILIKRAKSERRVQSAYARAQGDWLTRRATAPPTSTIFGDDRQRAVHHRCRSLPARPKQARASSSKKKPGSRPTSSASLQKRSKLSTWPTRSELATVQAADFDHQPSIRSSVAKFESVSYSNTFQFDLTPVLVPPEPTPSIGV